MKVLWSLGILLLCSFSLEKDLYVTQTASYYHNKFQGRKTASGVKFDQNKPIAASNIYPLGSKLEVCHIDKCVEVEVLDRISKKYSHRIDLSKSVFSQLADPQIGIIQVQIKQL